MAVEVFSSSSYLARNSTRLINAVDVDLPDKKPSFVMNIAVNCKTGDL